MLYIRPRSSGTKSTASSLFSSLDLTRRVHAYVSVKKFLPHPSRTFIHARGHRNGRFTKFKHERREKKSVSTWALFKYLSLLTLSLKLIFAWFLELHSFSNMIYRHPIAPFLWKLFGRKQKIQFIA